MAIFVNHNGKELELKFGLKFLNAIDRALGMEIEQASIGNGINMLVPNLESGNVLTIATTIKAGTSHHKKYPSKDYEVEAILDEIAETVGFEEFGKEIVEELGKRPMTRGLVEQSRQDEEETEAKEKKKK